MSLISVLIPTKDRPEWAMAALQSVLSAKLKNIEIIFSDNCSKNEPFSSLLNDPKVRFFRQSKPLSMVDHWNFCLAHAQGQFVKLLCDDDLLVPDGFLKEIQALEKHPHVSLVSSNRVEFSKKKETLIQTIHKETILPRKSVLKKMVFQENFIGPPSAVSFRKISKFQFPKEYSYACDWAAWIELLEKGDLIQLPSTSCKFRIHEKNLTNHFVETHLDFFEVQSLRKKSVRRIKSSAPVHLFYLLIAEYFFLYRMTRRILRCLKRKDFTSLQNFFRLLVSNP